MICSGAEGKTADRYALVMQNPVTYFIISSSSVTTHPGQLFGPLTAKNAGKQGIQLKQRFCDQHTCEVIPHQKFEYAARESNIGATMVLFSAIKRPKVSGFVKRLSASTNCRGTQKTTISLYSIRTD